MYFSFSFIFVILGISVSLSDSLRLSVSVSLSIFSSLFLYVSSHSAIKVAHNYLSHPHIPLSSQCQLLKVGVWKVELNDFCYFL